MTTVPRFLGHFVSRFPGGLPHFDNSVLSGLCQYDNQAFSANQSIITSNCRERCQCHHINGTAITTCKPLCPIEEDPKCHPHSERLIQFERSLNDTNCTCTKKRCVPGIKICNIPFLSLNYFISANNLMNIVEDLSYANINLSKMIISINLQLFRSILSRPIETAFFLYIFIEMLHNTNALKAKNFFSNLEKSLNSNQI